MHDSPRTINRCDHIVMIQNNSILEHFLVIVLDVQDEVFNVNDCAAVEVRGMMLTSQRAVRRDNNTTKHCRLNGGLPVPSGRMFERKLKFFLNFYFWRKNAKTIDGR